MHILAVFLSFLSMMVLLHKKVNMGISLLIGAVIAGLFLPLTLKETFSLILKGIGNPLTVELLIIVGFISGLGYMMKKMGDLQLMMDALVAIFKNATILSMLLPILIGTINIPGGAILSAPMVKESGDELELKPAQQAAINIFFRHIGYFVYPLYSSLIIASQLISLEKTSIIKYNIPIMLMGILAAFFVLFYGIKKKKKMVRESHGLLLNLLNFLRGFYPLLIIIILALFFKVSFPLAVTLGVLLALLKNPTPNPLHAYSRRIVEFFKKAISYRFLLVIIGVMAYKTVIEESGAIYSLSEQMLGLGLSLVGIVIVLGLITPLITGVHMAATGILIPLLTPLIPIQNLGPFISLLFTCIIIGYIVSPLHLCLVLTKEYYQVNLWSIYRLLFFPLLAMLLTGLLQVLLLT